MIEPKGVDIAYTGPHDGWCELNVVHDHPKPPAEGDVMLGTIRSLAKERTERVLNGLYKTFGPLNREQLGALLDGAQDATMNWLPPELRG